MAILITEHSLSLAWLVTLEHLLHCDGKDINVIVGMHGEEDVRIRRALDSFLAEHRSKEVPAVSTVANTIFPSALYLPRLQEQARSHLYRLHELESHVSGRHGANGKGTYFGRLVAYPGQRSSINQLEQTVLRLRSQLAQPNPKGSAYELALSTPEEEASLSCDAVGEMRLRQPGIDNQIMGFPCLSHISLTLRKGQLHMSALYRNQHFIRKAYGNYVGLARLQRFLCTETGCQAGEIICIASHADAEIGRRGFGKRHLAALTVACRRAVDAAA